VFQHGRQTHAAPGIHSASPPLGRRLMARRGRLTISPSNWAVTAESRVATACRSAGDSRSWSALTPPRLLAAGPGGAERKRPPETLEATHGWRAAPLLGLTTAKKLPPQSYHRPKKTASLSGRFLDTSRG